MASSPKTSKQLLVFLTPLIVFGITILAVVGFFQHKKMMEQTRITFSIQSPDNDFALTATATLDGNTVMSGQKISLGHHTLKITHPKGVPYETNFSAWYGGKDFGQIALMRARGTLSFKSSRPALVLNVNGPEIKESFTNVSEKVLDVPTDEYQLFALYPNRGSESQKIVVSEGQTTPCTFSPPYGSMHAVANRDDVTYKLRDEKNRLAARGSLPCTNMDLPGGTYHLAAEWHSHLAEQDIVVKNNETSEAKIVFDFGAALIETKPSGATVYDDNATQLGNTPLLVTELAPGQVGYRVHLDGFQDASVSIAVVLNQTNAVNTNLVNVAYSSGMQRAQDSMAVSNYNDAVASLNTALAAVPGDVDATALLRKATVRAAVEDAKKLAGTGDYIGAGLKLNLALSTSPDDIEAKELQPQYKAHEAEENALMREQQVRYLFEREWRKNPLGELFGANEYVTSVMSPSDARDALIKCYASQWPNAVAKVNSTLQDGVYEVWFDQSASGSDARRDMLVVFGKSKDDKTLILFKNIEFRMGDNGDWIPLNSSRIQMTDLYAEQIKVGVRMMLRKIKLAIGETNKY